MSEKAERKINLYIGFLFTGELWGLQLDISVPNTNTRVTHTTKKRTDLYCVNHFRRGKSSTLSEIRISAT